MLETPVYPVLATKRVRTISRKGSDALSENPQRLYAVLPNIRDEDIVRSPWRHGVHRIRGADNNNTSVIDSIDTKFSEFISVNFDL